MTEILKFDEKMMGPLTELLTDYLTLVAQSVKVEPWNYQVDIDEALAFTLANLSVFTPPAGNIFIAQRMGEPVGTASIKMIRPEVAELKRMYVKPEFQGFGVGELLLKRVVDEAKLFGATEIYLDSPPPLLPSHKLYQKHGFEMFDEYPEVSITEEMKTDWVYMRKTLD